MGCLNGIFPIAQREQVAIRRPHPARDQRNRLVIWYGDYKLIYFLCSKYLKKITILISFAALRTSGTHVIDFKTLL